MKWTTPSGKINLFYRDILTQPHTLIAGATGAGKSVIINGLIYTALFDFPGSSHTQLILCDPKRVELSKYANLPHTLYHAKSIPDILNALENAANIMENRFIDMEKRGLVETDRGHIYTIIDEYADLMLSCTKRQLRVMQHITELGRAAHVHLILATQAPSRQVITAPIAVNMTAKIALRCDNAIESRQIIGVSGAENLPQYGDCLYKAPGKGIQHYTKLPMYSQDELNERVSWWVEQIPPPPPDPPESLFANIFHRFKKS